MTKWGRRANVGGLNRAIKIDRPTEAQIAAYATAGENGLWLTVLEKTYVTLRNREKTWFFSRPDVYGSVKCGEFITEAIKVVTGHGVDTLVADKNTKQLDPNKVHAILSSITNASGKLARIATAGTPENPNWGVALSSARACIFDCWL